MDLERYKWVPWWLPVLTTLVGGVVVYFGSPYFQHSLLQQRDREAIAHQTRAENYNSVNQLIKQFNLEIRSFTDQLNQKSRVDAKSQQALLKTIAEQFDAVTRASVSIPEDRRAALDNYLKALAELRRAILQVKPRQGAEPFYSALRLYWETQKEAVRILEPSSS